MVLVGELLGVGVLGLREDLVLGFFSGFGRILGCCLVEEIGRLGVGEILVVFIGY